MLGLDEPLDWSVDDGALTLILPERLPISAAHALRVRGGLRPLGSRANR